MRWAILIVEDDADTAEMLRAYFEAQGYQIQVAAWGNDAIELCQQTVPDLIIQDIRLPDIDGYEVVRKLRKTARTCNVPIIFLTDRKAQSDKIAGLELGAVDYLTKPFDTQELRLRVRNALRRASYASLVNPVTGLPDREVTDERLTQLPAQDHWAAIFMAIVDLDTFSESYGFVASDDVLRAVGLILSNALDEAGSADDFVGHTDKASFLLVTQESKAADIRDRIAARLERAFNYFYPAKDLESGQVTALMRAEVGVITSALGPFRTGGEILAAAIAARKTVAASHPPKL
jgi:PleD family two-component response regulator